MLLLGSAHRGCGRRIARHGLFGKAPYDQTMIDVQADAPAMYQAVRSELVGELRRLGAASLSVVPACPEWSVKDVVAHLTGLNGDLLAGLPLQSIGSDEATSRQVGDRQHLTIDEVVDEWLAVSGAIDDYFSSDPNSAAALLADMVVHAYDIQEVLGQHTTVAARAIPTSAQRYANRLQHRLANDMHIALAVEFGDGPTCSAPEVDAGRPVTLRTSSFAFVRGVTGRLRRTEVEEFEWSVDPTEMLDRAWNLYGPFRE